MPLEKTTNNCNVALEFIRNPVLVPPAYNNSRSYHAEFIIELHIVLINVAVKDLLDTPVMRLNLIMFPKIKRLSKQVKNAMEALNNHDESPAE